jgi:hypothetical protein
MATISQIPLNEYLGMNYRPDREYVDGEIRERNVGKYEHARIQALLARWFGNHEQVWGVQVVTEQRVQVSPTRVRIPDVALLTLGSQPDVSFEPPLLVVELLSPDGSGNGMDHRSKDALRAYVLRRGMDRSLAPGSQRNTFVRQSPRHIQPVDHSLRTPPIRQAQGKRIQRNSQLTIDP